MSSLISFGPHRALGTEWYLELSQHKNAAELFSACTTLLEDFENSYSRFRKHSLLTTLNTTGRLANPSSEFIDLITQGQEYFTQSGGVFNILSAQAQEAQGYDAEYSFHGHRYEHTLPNPNTDIVIEKNQLILQAGKLDFGGFGKGYAIDMLRYYLQSHAIEEFIINGGGDMYVHTQQPTTLYLEHPFQPNQYTHKIDLRHSALAASSTNKRSWKPKNTKDTLSHILSDEDSNTLPGTFVTASHATEADAYATIYMLKHRDIPHTFPPQYPYLFVYPDQSSRTHSRFLAHKLY